MPTRVLVVLLVVSAVVLWSPLVAADPAEEAKHHFEEGSKAFSLGEFQRAVTEYKAGFEVRPDPVFLYNIGQSYRLAGNLADAVSFYRSYLRNAPNAPNRREVARRIHDLEEQLASQKVLSTAPPNSPVAPGGSAATEEPQPAATTEPPTTTTPPPPDEPTKTSAPVQVTASHDSDQTPVYKKWWLWTIVGGVVVVAVVVGVGVGVGTASGPTPPASHFGTIRF